MTTTTEIAWLAGLVEGEGCISPAHKHCWRVGVKMTDLDVLRRVQSIAGGVINGPYSPAKGNAGRKRYWTWALNRGNDVLALLYTLYPLLGERRRARATEAIQALRLKASWPGYGRPRAA